MSRINKGHHLQIFEELEFPMLHAKFEEAIIFESKCIIMNFLEKKISTDNLLIIIYKLIKVQVFSNIP